MPGNINKIQPKLTSIIGQQTGHLQQQSRQKYRQKAALAYGVYFNLARIFASPNPHPLPAKSAHGQGVGLTCYKSISARSALLSGTGSILKPNFSKMWRMLS